MSNAVSSYSGGIIPSSGNVSYPIPGGGLSCPKEMHHTSTGGLEIQPLEEKSLAYILGNKLREGFDSLYPLSSRVYQSVVNRLSNFALPNIPGASAASMSCKVTPVGNCKLPSIPSAITYSALSRFIYEGDLAAFEVINIKNPHHPNVVGSYAYKNVLGVSVDIASSFGDYAYSIFSDVRSGTFWNFHVFNVLDPTNPKLVSQNKVSNEYGYKVALLGNGYDYAYVLSSNSPVPSDYFLNVIDIKNPLSPKKVGRYAFSVPIKSIAISGNYVYATSSKGLVILDISNPVNPVQIKSLNLPGHPGDIVVVDNFAYVGSCPFQQKTKGILWIINIDAPMHAGIEGIFTDNHPEVNGYGTPQVNGRYVYLQCLQYAGPSGGNSKGFRIINIENPSKPVSAGFSNATSGDYAPGPTTQIIGNFFYFGALNSSLQAFEVNCE